MLSKGGLEALLELSPLADKEHPSSAEFALVSDFPRRDPHSGKGPGALELVQPASTELVGLVYHPQHHEFGPGGINESWGTSGLFDFIHDPVPVPHGLRGYRASRLTFGQEGADRSMLMGDFPLPLYTALLILHHGVGVPLMAVKGDIRRGALQDKLLKGYALLCMFACNRVFL